MLAHTLEDDMWGLHEGVVTLAVGGHPNLVWVEHLGETKMFRVERHLIYASHALA